MAAALPTFDAPFFPAPLADDRGGLGVPVFRTSRNPPQEGEDEGGKDTREIPDELPERERDLPPQEIPVNPA